MSFVQAVRSALSQYATFSGRARRSEYWWFTLFTVIVSILAAMVDHSMGTRDTFGGNGLVGGLLTLALFLPGLALSARRMHDIGRTGWWILINLIPLIGWIVWIVFCCTDSEGDNRFGVSPKFAPQRTTS